MALALLIVVLLSVAVPLLIGKAYRASRAWGAFVAAFWLLLAPFLAGMNFAAVWDLVFSHPFSCLATLAVAWAVVWFAGPRSAFMAWVLRPGPLRMAMLRFFRWLHERRISRRLAGDIFVGVAVFLLLVPVAITTLKLHPAYGYASNKVRSELGRRLPKDTAYVEIARNEALARAVEPGMPDGAAVAAAQGSIAESAARQQESISAIRTDRGRIDAARAQVVGIAESTRTRLTADAERASRQAMADASARLLDAERGRTIEASRSAMAEALVDIAARARRRIESAPIEEHRELVDSLIEAGQAEIARRGRDAAQREAQRLLDGKREDFAAIGRKAANEQIEEAVRAATAAMARVDSELKNALEREEGERIASLKRNEREAEEARAQEERRRADEAQAELDRINAAKRRAEVMGRFVIRPRTSFAGGQTFGSLYVYTLFECALACLEVDCDAFAFSNNLSNRQACYRHKGARVVPLENHPYYTGGMRR